MTCDLTWRLTKWLVTWLGLARKWLVTWLGLARKWLVTWLGLAKNDLLPSLPRMEAYNLTSVRPSVRPYVQRLLRSVWVNWFETLGQEQVRSEECVRQIDFWYHSKWWPGGHHGCKQTWSRNSNNTNWISFKLGAERTLGMANMYAHLFSVRLKKWRHGGHICVLTPMITLFWLISRKLCKIGD